MTLYEGVSEWGDNAWLFSFSIFILGKTPSFFLNLVSRLKYDGKWVATYPGISLFLWEVKISNCFDSSLDAIFGILVKNWQFKVSFFFWYSLRNPFKIHYKYCINSIPLYGKWTYLFFKSLNPILAVFSTKFEKKKSTSNYQFFMRISKMASK